MKKAILLILGIVLVWGSLSMYFMGSIPLSELTHVSVRVYDMLAVVLFFAGFTCIVAHNDITRKKA